jgi:hypothetical protein
LSLAAAAFPALLGPFRQLPLWRFLPLRRLLDRAQPRTPGFAFPRLGCPLSVSHALRAFLQPLSAGLVSCRSHPWGFSPRGPFPSAELPGLSALPCPPVVGLSARFSRHLHSLCELRDFARFLSEDFTARVPLPICPTPGLFSLRPTVSLFPLLHFCRVRGPFGLSSSGVSPLCPRSSQIPFLSQAFPEISSKEDLSASLSEFLRAESVK